MAEVTESFDVFLLRFVRKAIQRLVREERGAIDLLAEISMAARLRNAVDAQLTNLIMAGTYEDAILLDEILGSSYVRPTWREIGAALGVTPQAAHRKYGRAPRP